MEREIHDHGYVNRRSHKQPIASKSNRTFGKTSVEPGICKPEPNGDEWDQQQDQCSAFRLLRDGLANVTSTLQSVNVNRSPTATQDSHFKNVDFAAPVYGVVTPFHVMASPL